MFEPYPGKPTSKLCKKGESRLGKKQEEEEMELRPAGALPGGLVPSLMAGPSLLGKLVVHLWHRHGLCSEIWGIVGLLYRFSCGLK